MTDFDWKNLLNPEYYINLEIGGVHVGLWVVLFIIFAETGLFAGFFLPGDSLLFLAGIYATGYYHEGVYVPGLVDQMFHVESTFLNVVALSTFVAIAGILGNIVGYWFGSKSGNYLYNKQDSFWFKKKYLLQSRDFFQKHGGRAIIFSRFLPIFRTFAPIVAGIVAMDKKKFMFYNIVSSFLWAFTLIFAGNYLYKYLKNSYQIDLKDHIELIIIGLVGITIIPVIYKFGKKTVTHSEE